MLEITAIKQIKRAKKNTEVTQRNCRKQLPSPGKGEPREEGEVIGTWYREVGRCSASTAASEAQRGAS